MGIASEAGRGPLGLPVWELVRLSTAMEPGEERPASDEEMR